LGTAVRSGCKYNALTKRVTEIESTDVDVGDAALEREYVELPDGKQLDESDGVIFDY
jgi:hypothetical protein